MQETKEEFKKHMKNKVKIEDNKETKSRFYKLFFFFAIKILIMAILFLGSLIYIRQCHENKVKFKKIVYQNTLSFAKIYSVYSDYLGDLIPFKGAFKKDTKVVFNEKIEYEQIEKYNDGFSLEVSSNFLIPFVKGGIVIAIMDDEVYGKIVKIQDKSGLEITYGNLSQVNVALYDYVEKGQYVGNCEKKLYLVFKKAGKYLSYEKYL
ncbi:MAG: M23 family metallopeptidase [Bacilli bacterium]